MTDQPFPEDGKNSPSHWHLVTGNATSGAAQMALDQAVAESVWGGRRPAAVRIYGWRRPALTIGRLQHPPVLPCRAVRRLTGGRAVYHEDEVTVALALPRGHPLIGATVRATYRTLAAPMGQALIALGIPLDREPAPGRTAGADRFACFTTPAPFEGQVGGHKVMAMAQHLGPDGLLMQACIPLTRPTRLPGAAQAGMVGLTQFVPGLTREALAAALVTAFGQRFGGAPTPAPLSHAERHRAADLARGPYRPLSPRHRPIPG